MFRSLVTMKTTLTSVQFGERTTSANGEVEAEGPQAGHRKRKGRIEGRKEGIGVMVLEGRGDRVTCYLVRGQSLLEGCSSKD